MDTSIGMESSVAPPTAAIWRLLARGRCHVEHRLTVRMTYGFELGFASGMRLPNFVSDEGQLTGSP